mmetsp:Transcript_21993/g.70798  ORF Transcript_21993/g.70798 Transcript_21993/m.70798 type:complete len:225 (-) Transcript_21993:1147-1821(-)
MLCKVGRRGVDTTVERVSPLEEMRLRSETRRFLSISTFPLAAAAPSESTKGASAPLMSAAFCESCSANRWRNRPVAATRSSTRGALSSATKPGMACSRQMAAEICWLTCRSSMVVLFSSMRVRVSITAVCTSGSSPLGSRRHSSCTTFARTRRIWRSELPDAYQRRDASACFCTCGSDSVRWFTRSSGRSWRIESANTRHSSRPRSTDSKNVPCALMPGGGAAA